MPTSTLDSELDAISSITKKYFFPKLVDQVTTSNPLLMQLEKSGGMKTIDGGEDIRVPVRYTRFSSRGWYAGDETLPVAYNEKKFALIFDWKQYNVSVPIIGLDKLKNMGSSKVIDHVQSEMDAAEEDLKNDFGDGVYSDGTDTKEIIGTQVFGSTSNTYGGVSQSSESWLQAKVDSSTTTLTLAAMQERYEAASEPPIKPNFITTTETLFNSYHALLTPVQRFTDSKVADGGFANLLFRGAPVVEDSHCPSGDMNFWTLKFVALYSHKARKFPGEFVDFEKPVNQDAAVAHIYWAGAFINEAPRFFGIMDSLTA